MGINLLSSAYSEPAQGLNCCPTKPYETSNFVTRGIQGVFGLNWLFHQVAESQVEKQIKKVITSGDVKVKIKPYSAMDLLDGKMRSFDVKGKNIVANGFHISSFEVKSLCDYVSVDYKKNPVELREPVLAGLKASITQNDINKSLSSPEWKENFEKIKVKVFDTDISLFEFLDPRVEIDKDKIYISSSLHLAGTPRFLSIPLYFGTGLRVDNNKLKFVGVKMISKGLGANLGPISEFLDKMAVCALDFNLLNNSTMNINIKKILVNNGKIDLDGTLWLAAAPKSPQK